MKLYFVKKELERRGIYFQSQELKKYSYIGIGGWCEFVCFPKTVWEITEIVSISRCFDMPYFVLGGGTNTLFSTKGFEGIVISLSQLSEISIDGKNIYVSAGSSLPSVIHFCINNSLSGLEFCLGVPCSVGGAIWSNFGANSCAISDFIKEVVVLDAGEIKTLSTSQLNFSYRSSRFKKSSEIILFAKFQLTSMPSEIIKNKCMNYINVRRQTQPINIKTLGSTFKNNPRNSAYKLIRGAGCENLSVGGIKVNKLHANFLENYNNATSEDVEKIIDIIKKMVYNKYKVNLETEIIILE